MFEPPQSTINVPGYDCGQTVSREEAQVEQWRREDMQQQHLDNAMVLWTRYVTATRNQVVSFLCWNRLTSSLGLRDHAKTVHLEGSLSCRV